MALDLVQILVGILLAFGKDLWETLALDLLKIIAKTQLSIQAQDLAVGLGQVLVRILARIPVSVLALDLVKILVGLW